MLYSMLSCIQNCLSHTKLKCVHTYSNLCYLTPVHDYSSHNLKSMYILESGTLRFHGNVLLGPCLALSCFYEVSSQIWPHINKNHIIKFHQDITLFNCYQNIHSNNVNDGVSPKFIKLNLMARESK